jgi:hypothetical protein
MKAVCRDSRISWLFFIVGLIATIALRVIEPLRLFDPLYAKVSWYVGVSGFFLFFAYKYAGILRTSRLVRESGLMERIHCKSKLSEGDYSLLAGVICAQDNWKERVNYFAIFLLSAAALAVALWFDLTG